MSRLLALDPGIQRAGAALFEDGRLVRAALVTSAAPREWDVAARCRAMAYTIRAWTYPLGPDSVREVAAEWPQVYRAGRAKRGADPNDLLALSGVVAAAATLFESAVHDPAVVRTYLPRDWKGTLGDNEDGDYLVEQRVCGDQQGRGGRLDAVELEVIAWPAESLKHNVVDAIGIGLHHLGRGIVAGRRRVIAR